MNCMSFKKPFSSVFFRALIPLFSCLIHVRPTNIKWANFQCNKS